jgi:hypothetical protein
MPMREAEHSDAQRRVLEMFMDTVRTFEALHQYADTLFGPDADTARAAIDECLTDFVRETALARELHPEVLIYQAPARNFQRAGFYGAQLDLKQAQVAKANGHLRQSLSDAVSRRALRRPFLKWIDAINNFLGSLASATGLGEALKELKDCLRDQMPDEE